MGRHCQPDYWQHRLWLCIFFASTGIPSASSGAEDFPEQLPELIIVLNATNKTEDVIATSGGVPSFDYSDIEAVVDKFKEDGSRFEVAMRMIQLAHVGTPKFRRRAYHAIDLLCTKSDTMTLTHLAFIHGVLFKCSVYEKDALAKLELSRVTRRLTARTGILSGGEEGMEKSGTIKGDGGSFESEGRD